MTQKDFRNTLITTYGKCSISDDTELSKCIATHIIPQNLCYKYNTKITHIDANGILLRQDIKPYFDKFIFSIIPIPEETFIYNDKSYVIVNCIGDDGFSFINQKKMHVLYSSLFFFKWHYLKYLEKRQTEVLNMTESENYLKDIIGNINKIDNDNIYDEDGDIIMLQI